MLKSILRSRTCLIATLLTGLVVSENSLTARALAAQSSVVVNAAAASAFVWRGVHFTNRPVVQGDVTLMHARGSLLLTSGVWMNAEPADYASASAMRMLAPGHHGPAITAIAPWADATITQGALSVTGGAIVYRYPQRTGFAEAFNSTELYAKVASTGVLAPRVQAWFDIGKISGAYVETAVSHAIELRVPVTTTVTAGWSVGQEINGSETWYFSRAGLAAVDVAMATSLRVGVLTVTPTLHGVYGHDEAARLLGPGLPLQRVKFWGTLGASWTP